MLLGGDGDLRAELIIGIGKGPNDNLGLEMWQESPKPNPTADQGLMIHKS